MAALMNRDEFRTALENAIKGKSANKAPFSVAWASGKLSRAQPQPFGPRLGLGLLNRDLAGQLALAQRVDVSRQDVRHDPGIADVFGQIAADLLGGKRKRAEHPPFDL